MEDCIVCKKPTTNTCSSCLKAFYCSQACQKIDWPTHKSACQSIKSAKAIEIVGDDEMNEDLRKMWQGCCGALAVVPCESSTVQTGLCQLHLARKGPVEADVIDKLVVCSFKVLDERANRPALKPRVVLSDTDFRIVKEIVGFLSTKLAWCQPSYENDKDAGPFRLKHQKELRDLDTYLETKGSLMTDCYGFTRILVELAGRRGIDLKRSVICLSVLKQHQKLNEALIGLLSGVSNKFSNFAILLGRENTQNATVFEFSSNGYIDPKGEIKCSGFESFEKDSYSALKKEVLCVAKERLDRYRSTETSIKMMGALFKKCPSICNDSELMGGFNRSSALFETSKNEITRVLAALVICFRTPFTCFTSVYND